MEITTDRLFQIIGEKEAELSLVRGQLAVSRQQTAAAVAEVDRLKVELAKVSADRPAA